MPAKELVLLKKVYNSGEAEVIRGLLEAQDIEVLLTQEGAGKAIGLSIGALGEIQIHVPADDEEQAQTILGDFLEAD